MHGKPCNNSILNVQLKLVNPKSGKGKVLDSQIKLCLSFAANGNWSEGLKVVAAGITERNAPQSHHASFVRVARKYRKDIEADWRRWFHRGAELRQDSEQVRPPFNAVRDGALA